MTKKKKGKIERIELRPEVVREFWVEFVVRNAKRIQPYEEAQALAMSTAAHRVCR